MHQYKIVIYRYTEQGAVGDYVTTLYADDAEKVSNICRQHDGYQLIVNEDTGEVTKTNNKLYKVEIYTLGYNLVDKSALFALHRV